MTLNPGDDSLEASRQRTRNQLELIQQDPSLLIATETGDLADFTFICDREHFLVPPQNPDPDQDAVNLLQTYFGGRDDEFEDPGGLSDGQTRVDLFRRYRMPTRRAREDQELLRTLAEVDEDFGIGFARPDHLVHIAGQGSCCPATEPAETGLKQPWPRNDELAAGAGVKVVVIDTGWYPPAGSLEWLDNVDGDPETPPIPEPPGMLAEYAGHGTFVAGVVKAMARGCTVQVLNLDIDRQARGGGVLESQLVMQLDAALELEPDLINLSAGCRTRLGLPARTFEDWWNDLTTKDPERDLVLVAAAGNNASPWYFYPASFDWAVGVGFLDLNGFVSSFSNFGLSVDVFALGRNLVNAFPKGTYICQERPDQGSRREFTHMLARWSGTSFAAPLVTGMIAAEMSRQPGPRSARTARDTVLASGRQVLSPVTSLVSVIDPPPPPQPA